MELSHLLVQTRASHLLSPTSINSLPSELLHYIIDLTHEEVTLPPSFRDSSNSWALSHIWSSFRRIVLHSSRFWTDVTITIDRGVSLKAPKDTIDTLLNRGQRSRIRLYLAWSLGEAAEHVGNSRFPRLPSSNPVSIVVDRALSSFCTPFVTRVSSVSMLFQNLDIYELVRSRLHVLPKKFFIGISGIHLYFMSGLSSVSVLQSDAALEERLFDSWTQVSSPEMTVQAWARYPQLGHEADLLKREISTRRVVHRNRIHRALDEQSPVTEIPCIPLPLWFGAPQLSQLACLALTGTGLRHSPQNIYTILTRVRNLQSFSAWLDEHPNSQALASSFSRMAHEVLELPYLIHLDVTICNYYAAADGLGELLHPLAAPTLANFTVSMCLPRSLAFCNMAERPTIHDSKGRVKEFLVRCSTLSALKLSGIGTAQDLSVTRLLLPDLQITVK